MSSASKQALVVAVIAVGLGYILIKRQEQQIQKAKNERDMMKQSSSESDDIDFSDPTVIYGRLNKLLESVGAQVTIPLESYRFNVALGALVYPSFSKGIKKFQLHRAPERFASDPKPTKAELQDLKTYLKYSDWAYEESSKELGGKLREEGYVMLRHHLDIEPGTVAHYLAYNSRTHDLLIGVKGTSSMADVLTDIMAAAVSHELPTNPFTGQNEPCVIRAHDGMLSAAKVISNTIGRIIQDLFLPLGYTITVCGHSLGAGTACLLGILLKAAVPEIGGRLKVWAFATPAILDQASATGCRSFVTTIVNDSDCVPRASVMNLQIMIAMVVEVDKMLEEQNLAPKSKWDVTPVELMKKLNEEEFLKENITFESTQALLDKAQSTLEPSDQHLHTAGRVIHFYQASTKEGGKEEDLYYGAAVIDGTHPSMRCIDLDETLITDHLIDGYTKSLNDATERA